MPDIHDTLDERGKRYGDFTDHSDISETLLGAVMFKTVALPSFGHPPRESWTNMTPFQRQALRTICDKLARIANGDPHYDDNWRDIAGYATLVLDRLGSPKAPRQEWGPDWPEDGEYHDAHTGYRITREEAFLRAHPK